MLEQVAAAFDRQDYRTATQLLKELLKQSPQDPWVQLYLARLQEVSGKASAAENIYRQLLRQSSNPKLMAQARQGLQRLELAEKERRQQAIAQATADASSQEPGVMILEGVAGENRNALVQRFAQIMKIDAYTARGLLPSRGWRLYRSGSIGELQVYGQELLQAEIPVFWASLSELQALQVFRVNYFQTFTPTASVVCRNEANQPGLLSFTWSEVEQRVEGLLPIFGQVVDLGYRDRLEWKEHVEDYVHVCDLHLIDRQCILRLVDSQYDFHQGVSANVHHDTIRQYWNELTKGLNQQLPETLRQSLFTPFAETTEDFAAVLDRLPSHINLARSTDCYLDAAFHLYSTLAFLQRARAIAKK